MREQRASPGRSHRWNAFQPRSDAVFRAQSAMVRDAEAVMAMVSQAAGRIRVKASGGIRTLEDARAYVEMGAERLGVGFSTVPKLTAAEGQNN